MASNKTTTAKGGVAWPSQQTGVDFLSKANGALDLPEQSTVYQKLLSAKAKIHVLVGSRRFIHVRNVSQMHPIMNDSSTARDLERK